MVPNMLEEIDQGVRGLRIGLDEEYISGNTDPQVVGSVLEGIRVMEGLGAVIVPIQIPDTSDYTDRPGSGGAVRLSLSRSFCNRTFFIYSSRLRPKIRL